MQNVSGTRGTQTCAPTGPVGGGVESLGKEGSEAGGLMNINIPHTSFLPYQTPDPFTGKDPVRALL